MLRRIIVINFKSCLKPLNLPLQETEERVESEKRVKGKLSVHLTEAGS